MSVSHAPDPRCSTTGQSDAGVAGVRALADMFDGIADPRKLRGIRHQISAVLTVMVLAVLAGARNFREIADRGAELPDDLLTLAGCRVHPTTGEHVVPSAATIRRVAHGIDANATDERVSAWLRTEALARAIAQDVAGEQTDTLVAVAMDGKTIRNTIEPGGAEGGEIKLFSALTHAEAIVIAQHRIPAGTNETTQVRALLSGVDLRGVVVTGDAAHACHATAAHIATERGGHYAITVKGNHPGLLAPITAALPPAAPGSEHHVAEDHSHGRVVRRAIWVAPADGIDFPGAAQVFRIRRDTFDHLGRRLSKERARSHQPDRRTDHTRTDRWPGPESLAHREQEPLGTGCRLPRRPPARLRGHGSPGHGRPAQPGAGPATPGRHHLDHPHPATHRR